MQVRSISVWTAIEAVMNAPLATAAAGEAGDGGTGGARVRAAGRPARCGATAERRCRRRLMCKRSLVVEVRRLQEELPAVAARSAYGGDGGARFLCRCGGVGGGALVGPVRASACSRSRHCCRTIRTWLRLSRWRALARRRESSCAINSTRLDNEIIRAARQSQAGAGFWGRIQAALAQWIVIRQAGAGRYARRHRRPGASNISRPIAWPTPFKNSIVCPTRQSASAQPWINDAQRRLEIDSRITAIRQELSRS
jgi:hypothetical protein